MSIRLPTLQSTLEHVQLNFGFVDKHTFAEIKLDTRNLTKPEITKLREVLKLAPLDEWYPKVMREIVVWSFYKKTDDPSTEKLRRTFEHKYQEIMDHTLEPEMWVNKGMRHKQGGKHAKAWAAKTVGLCVSAAPVFEASADLDYG